MRLRVRAVIKRRMSQSRTEEAIIERYNLQ